MTAFAAVTNDYSDWTKFLVTGGNLVQLLG
jgi:hypothetical protein